ncbi:MAG: hypothetical protein AAF580_09580 [Pseudomonadota bacterium]
MGGYGSGRPRSTYHVEDALALNLAKLIRDQLIRPGRWRGDLVWRNTETGEKVGSISYIAIMCPETGTGSIELHYAVHNGAGQRTLHREDVMLEALRQPYGGWLWYFRCPRSDRRCRKLFLPPGEVRFAARQVYKLPYRSQADAPFDRALSQAFKIRDRLKAVTGIGDVVWRPKGMHEATFQRELARLASYEAVCEARIMEFVKRL